MKNKIISLRQAIRYARDQKGDDRCWLDYWPLYEILEDTNSSMLEVNPNSKEIMQICTSFYEKRRQDYLDTPVNAILERDLWNSDLDSMNSSSLAKELEKIEETARKHRDTPILELTVEDDKTLYQILPENISADFRLPPREQFLGTSNPCAGCPNFWKSHANCKAKKHNFQSWGPCDK